MTWVLGLASASELVLERLVVERRLRLASASE